MKTPSLIIFIPICIAFAAIMWFIIWNLFFRKQRMAHEHEYNVRYKYIEKLINESTINCRNYAWIDSLLYDLGQMKYKNHEKTEVLSYKFWTRYKDIAKKEIEEFELTEN